MRIAINTRFLLKGRLEGIGRVTYELVRRLVDNNPTDEFLFLFDRPYDPSFVFADNVKAKVVFPPARHPILWKCWFDWSLPKVLKEWKADVFLSPDGYCSLRSRVPTLMITHDIVHIHYPEQINRSALYFINHHVPKYLTHAQKIVTVSNFTKKDIVEQYKIDPSKIEVIYNACQEQFKPLADKEKKAVQEKYSNGFPYFFYVGALHPRKNVDTLIRAFDQFKKDTGASIKLLIGGRWAWRIGAIKDAYDQAEHKADISFLGFVNEAELPRLLAAAHAFTYISHFEGFGLPVLEALHCEVPSIVSNTSSLPEVGGDAVLYVDPKKESEVVDEMKKLYTDKSLHQALKVKAQQQRLKFSWDDSARRLYQLLQDLA